MRYSLEVLNTLWWDEEDAVHIRSRSTRYSGATDIEPEWTLEAAADPARVVRDPDPKSRVAYTRLIGYSPSPEFVLTVRDHRPAGFLRRHGLENPRH